MRDMDGSDEEEDEENQDQAAAEEAGQKDVFEDDATISMFGSAVSVTVNDDIPLSNGYDHANEEDSGEEEDGEGDDDSDNDNQSMKSSRSMKSVRSTSSFRSTSSYTSQKKGNTKVLTPFERAMAKAKEMIGSKKKKRNNVDKNKNIDPRLRKRVKSSKLLAKVMSTTGHGNKVKFSHNKKKHSGRR
jgi:hypothetical protein